MNHGYSGQTTNGENTPAAAHHATTVNGPHISLKIAQGVAFFVRTEI